MPNILGLEEIGASLALSRQERRFDSAQSRCLYSVMDSTKRFERFSEGSNPSKGILSPYGEMDITKLYESLILGSNPSKGIKGC